MDCLAFKLSVPGRNVSALGSCAAVRHGESQAGRLTLAHQLPEEFSQAWANGTEVKVAGPEVWQRLIRTVTHELAPAEKGTGSLLLLESHEVIAFRDGSGTARLVPLEKRPPGMKIRRTFREQDLSAWLFAAGKREVPGLADGPVILLTGQSPPLVFLNPSTKRVIFLHAPVAEPFELSLLGLEEIPSSFTLRTATAVFWSANFVSALNNPVSFIGRGANGLLSILRKFIEWRPRLRRMEISPLRTDRPEMDLVAWQQRVDKIAHNPEQLASLEFLIDGEEFFPRYIQAVQDAKSTVDARLFIFDNDDYGVKLADLFRAKAQENVKVHVMMDELGSLFASQSDPLSPMPGGFKAPANMEDYLKSNSKVKVRAQLNPWLTASHTKTFLVDGKRAWLGGMNFGREYRYDWHDLMVEVNGPLVAQIQSDFNRVWAHAGPGGDLAWAWERIFPSRTVDRHLPVPANAIPVQPLYTRSLWHEIEQTQLQAMRTAQRRIWVENAYLADHRIIRELIAARRRGVDVRVVLPEKNDSGIIAASLLVTISDLMENGVRVYKYPGMTHVKAAIYDGWACLGSANFDRFSLQGNFEFNIGFSAPREVGILSKRLFETDFNRSKELREIPSVPWVGYLADWLANEL